MKNYRVNQFDNLQKKQANKSLFDLSHEVKTQMCFGRYYPILFEECLPGDEWTIDGEYSFRFPSTYFPIQQIGTMRADWFYVPYKLLWNGTVVLDPFGNESPQKKGWQGFIMGEDLELPTVDLNINGDSYNSQPITDYYPGASYPIENYLGFPMDTHGYLDASKQFKLQGSAFPLAMYLFCYDEYYRNPQWEEPVFTPLFDGDNTSQFNLVTQTVNGTQLLEWAPTGLDNKIIQHPPFFAWYEKDYFTTARPEPQDGDAILIPSLGLEEDGTFTPQPIKNVDGTPADASSPLYTGTDSTLRTTSGSGDQVVVETQATIKQLRLYQVLQQFHERVMRIGKRYRGYIEGLWGNDPEPNAVDIPQLIGSHFGRIVISDAITTADTTGDNSASTGNYRGNINFYNNGTTHHYYCQDYGMLMCIMNIMPNTAYSQGIHPAWTREVNTDFALDMFSGIGDQEIKRKELLAMNSSDIWADADEPYNATIGYQDRFAEYKTRVNRIFNTRELYNSFYMGQLIEPTTQAEYENIDCSSVMVGASIPAINNGIRESDIFNIQPIKDGTSTYVDSTIWAHMYFTLKVKRCLPYFSTPGKMII